MPEETKRLAGEIHADARAILDRLDTQDRLARLDARTRRFRWWGAVISGLVAFTLVVVFVWWQHRDTRSQVDHLNRRIDKLEQSLQRQGAGEAGRDRTLFCPLLLTFGAFLIEQPPMTTDPRLLQVLREVQAGGGRTGLRAGMTLLALR